VTCCYWPSVMVSDPRLRIAIDGEGNGHTEKPVAPPCLTILPVIPKSMIDS
jgi:hypothetical protein